MSKQVQITQQFTYKQIIIIYQNKTMPRTIRQPIRKEDNFGRPVDPPLQIFFMNKLRQGKLKVIHAQSQAQIQCFQYADKNPQIYLSSATSSKKQKNKNYAIEKINMLKDIFERKDKSFFKDLYKSFKTSAENWQFKEINSEADFPQFLFDDECDLSYVLHSYLNTNIVSLKAKTSFQGRQLLYFELMCFAARDQISFKTIKTFQQYYDQIIDHMKVVNDKIQAYFIQNPYEGEIKAQNTAGNVNLENICNMPAHLRQGQLRHLLPEIDQESNSDPNKTKQIRKEQKTNKKKGRPKKIDFKNIQDQLIPLQCFQTLFHKITVHIVWAYIYIYPAVLRKRLEAQ